MTETKRMRVAIIDNDSGFLQVLGNRMDRMGWEQRISRGPISTDALVAMRVAAVVIDPALYGPRGLDELSRICDAIPALGVLVCTGASSVGQRTRGLRAGADDWITKPCHPEEVIARIEAVVRRRRRSEALIATVPLHAGELEIRADRYQAFVGGESVDLTRREYELIALFAESGDRVLPREEIYERIWGYSMAHGDRSVDVFVRKLRQKLEATSPGWRYVHTHFGVGYRFAPEPLTPADALVAAGPVAV